MPLIRYPEDLTGVNPDNRILNEIHTISPYTSSRPRRIVIPNFRPFFTDTTYLKLYDLGSSTPLTPLVKDADYKCVELSEEASIASGKEVCHSVIIENINVSEQVAVSYQTVGGLYTNDTANLVSLINTGLNDTRPVPWDNLLGKPFEFESLPHPHHLNDVIGYAPLIVALERLQTAITLSNNPAFERLVEYVRREIANHTHQDILQMLTTKSNIGHTHADILMALINKADINHTHPELANGGSGMLSRVRAHFMSNIN